ncbi:hypothetical protein [Serpentinicella alkaliphila]|uniref:Fluoroquinolone transport system permease protein n=1 Tax=Serpentinicella alkaliphila TaxID=1734049 RepID=A0A4R2TGX6_9FIRM|nr:hypothetical protein [Serpentinicella alkaliphila]QUH25908.1 hypothetical protein HZR23_09285 [Serpentinicella alkaliphila]TCQ01976.1 fluoroquinolone transport system permease protein [Serpentinicella alkaliphila]
MSRTSFKADMKIILREPILLLFILLPLLIALIFKALINFGEVYVYTFTGIVLENYYGYILTGVFLITPSMLGTVTGFLMIDERDVKINELIGITPIGYSGYVMNRLIIPFFGSIIYTLYSYYLLNIYKISFVILGYIAVLLGLQGILVGLILYKIADDKVKGLTYSKGMSIFTVLAMADLINNDFIIYIASITPFYWITRLIIDGNKAYSVTMAAIVHLIYFLIIVWLGKIYRE